MEEGGRTMNGENFNIFKEMFKVYKAHPDEKPNFQNEFIQNIDEGITNAKIFEMEEDVKKLLILSKPPKINSDLKMPFNEFFIDVSFEKEELINMGFDKHIFGILVRRGNYFYEKDRSVAGDDLRITVCMSDSEMTLFNTSSMPLDYKDNKIKSVAEKEYKMLNKDLQEKKAQKFVENFVLCFINLINFRDVDIQEVERSEKGNMHRIRKGKSPLPTTTRILVKGVIRRYIDNIRNHPQWSYNYSFWVVGHFRRLESERYKIKKRIWIMPYLKGHGKEVRKFYRICSNGGEADE